MNVCVVFEIRPLSSGKIKVSHVLDGGELVSFTLQTLNPPLVRREISASMWSQAQFGCGGAGKNSIPLESSPSYPVQVARDYCLAH
jgi:hypothetical protein